ncbi:MAG: RiPP maturation radical SAM C-methyltransferase [Planctomycetota bacterium]
MKTKRGMSRKSGTTGAVRPRSRAKSNGVDFCFVVMPYSTPKIPSPSVGLLQAILELDGLKTKSVYGNIMFWDEIGVDLFELVSKSLDTLFWIGSWTFSHIAFPDFHPDNEAFLTDVRERCHPIAGYDLADFRKDMYKIRKLTSHFTEKLAKQVLKTKPRIVGCSVTFQSQHVATLALLRRIKELAPDVITVMGGSNCETVMGLTTHKCFPWVDYVVSGEADDLIVPLTRDILEYGRDIPAEKVPYGVFAPVHREGGYPWDADARPDEVPRATAKTLAGLPTPIFDDFFATFNASPVVKKQVIPGLVYETSRGCWWGRCKFCGLNGCLGIYRSKPVNEVLRDFEALHRRYGLNSIETMDNIMDMDYFSTLLPELIRRGAPYNIFYETRSILTREHFELLYKSGVRWIQPGIESLHSEVLKLMRKGCKAYQNVQILKWARQYGIRTQWAILFDFPQEKDIWYEEMADLIPLLYHLAPPFGFIAIRYHRYSHYCRNAKKYNLDFRVPSLLHYVYPLSSGDLWNLVYEFEEESRENLKRNTILTLLLARTGIQRLTKIFPEWVDTFWSDKQPVLAMTVTDSEIAIRDTRPVAVAPKFRLTGLERDLYLACEEAQKPNDLYAKFASNGVTRPQVDAVVQSLLDRKLLARIDNRLLGLAVREPIQEFLHEEQFPGGAIRNSVRDHESIGDRISPSSIKASAAEERRPRRTMANAE